MSRGKTSIAESFGNYPLGFSVRTSDRLECNETAIGVEIELENMPQINDKVYPRKYWILHHDGSLRNEGREFIMGATIGGRHTVPFTGLDIVKALDAWDEFIKDHIENYGAPHTTKRTSVHIHMDVRDLTFEQVSAFIVLYVIFERVLFTYCGQNRDRNIYCLPLTTNKGLLEAIGSYFADTSLGRVFHGYCNKYDALNLFSITQKGSVECRMHPGCYDSERILEWINVLLSIKNFAKNFDIERIRDLPEQVSMNGLDTFLREVFHKYSDVLTTDTTRKEIMEGIREAQAIIYAKDLAKYNKGFERSTKYQKVDKKELLLQRYANAHGLSIQSDNSSGYIPEDPEPDSDDEDLDNEDEDGDEPVEVLRPARQEFRVNFGANPFANIEIPQAQANQARPEPAGINAEAVREARERMMRAQREALENIRNRVRRDNL